MWNVESMVKLVPFTPEEGEDLIHLEEAVKKEGGDSEDGQDRSSKEQEGIEA
jgi:hypothetical protein